MSKQRNRKMLLYWPTNKRPYYSCNFTQLGLEIGSEDLRVFESRDIVTLDGIRSTISRLTDAQQQKCDTLKGQYPYSQTRHTEHESIHICGVLTYGLYQTPSEQLSIHRPHQKCFSSLRLLLAWVHQRERQRQGQRWLDVVGLESGRCWIYNRTC